MLVIDSFGNKIACDVFTYGATNKLDAKHIKRSKFLLDIMDAVDTLEELKTLGFPSSIRLHKLKWDRKDTWAIDIFKVSGWRITFKFNGKFEEVTIKDYHD